MCTSVDAAFLYRTHKGTTELALVEWKYTEQYGTMRKPTPGYDKTRITRYGESYHAADGPLRSELLEIEWILDEPFYQLMRQQLLAWHLERDRLHGADAVRVLHVLPPDNPAYQDSLVRPQHRALGEDVVEMGVLLTHSSDFAGLNDEYARWFRAEPPARYMARLGVDIPGVLVSIRMTAFVD